MTKTAYIVGALIAVALLAAYVIITVTDHDGTGLLGALIGWLGGISLPAATQKATPNG
jgi:hypothetical protein